MELGDIIDEAIKDEIKGRDEYRGLSVRLHGSGYHSEAEIVSGMADDEDRHANLLMTMMRAVVPGYKYFVAPGFETIPAAARLFPKTYGDWVTLAEDIKTRCVGDVAAIALVNEQLGIIAEEDMRPREAQMAKQWFVTKAGELGIR